ncbi:hypothetical protein ACN20G_32070 (plasmid) [Streptomyces sp. BI20]|uniref:hypothetical protein n=1 Tax=Streptomyces sp. BI20 TaxID=3403460 RepID=UPI003C7727B7
MSVGIVVVLGAVVALVLALLCAPAVHDRGVDTAERARRRRALDVVPNPRRGHHRHATD